MTSTSRRDSYLLDGRRVLIADLIQAGLLAPGDRLEFIRPRLVKEYTATVTPDGKIQISDGRSFTSPSRAATSAVGGGSFDGWIAWRVGSAGPLLSVLRQQLLDLVLADAQNGNIDDSDNSVPHRHEFLRKAKQRASDSSPVEVSVRELIRHWGLDSREQAGTDRVQADIENYGLHTDPNFAKVGLDTVVMLVPSAPVDDAEDQLAPTDDDDDLDELSVIEVGVTLGNLPSAANGVASITPEASLDEAITTMLLNDYSQLPVMAGKRDVRGAVTWQSIARAQHAEPVATLGSAIGHASSFSYETELIDVLATLQDEDFVLVRDSANLVTGIVTTADVVGAYGQLATPFFLIGELDQLLRRIIRENFSLETVRDFCDPSDGRQLSSYDSLTMGDYEHMLENPKYWSDLGWSLDRPTFLARLRELRRARNAIMHFSPDPVSEDIVLKIRNMIHVLKRYGL